jgi:ribosomal protein L32
MKRLNKTELKRRRRYLDSKKIQAVITCCWCGSSRVSHMATAYCEHDAKVALHRCCDDCKVRIESGDEFRWEPRYCSQKLDMNDCYPVRMEFKSLEELFAEI